jgi:hypothetical protein
MELDVTPWSVAPEALPPWQTLASVPKSPAADDAGEDAEPGADDAPPPARLQPAAITAVTATAVSTFTAGRTTFPPR